MQNNDIDFIARRYRKGRFSAESGWRRLGIAPSFQLRRLRVAAAIAVTVILSATAAIIYNVYRVDDVSQPAPIEAVSPMSEVRAIDFENATLYEVVKKIEAIYGVRIDNLPERPEEYRLSLHYEGTPAELIATINDILGTQMTVTEK